MSDKDYRARLDEILGKCPEGSYKTVPELVNDFNSAVALCQELIEEAERLKEGLVDMVSQHCYEDGKVYCSGALSANADAIRLLIELGCMEQVGDSYGRMISAKFKEAP